MIKSQLVQKIDGGYVSMDVDELIDEMLCGNVVDNISLDDPDELEHYHESCRRYGITPKNLAVQKTPLNELSKKWRIPKEYLEIDIVDFLMSKCKTELEMQRVSEEFVEFYERDQLIIINLMIYIVDVMRKNNVVWGVGRGSSVASFCLFLIGINKINPMQHGISYREFFK